MMKTGQLYYFALNKLREAGRLAPAFDVSCLFGLHFGLDRGDIILKENETLSESGCLALISDVNRLCAGYPLQYILGKWEFMGLDFFVGQGVLIPRPDTETLVEAAMELLTKSGRKNTRIADLCAGSGAVAISLAKLVPGVKVDAYELSEDALDYLNKNNRHHGGIINVVQADVLKKPDTVLQYDCIVSNPPYITARDMRSLSSEVKKEPQMALYGGEDGLTFYRGISDAWYDSVRRGGCILFEIGKNQHTDVAAILRTAGYEKIFFKKDLAGIIRVVGGYKA